MNLKDRIKQIERGIGDVAWDAYKMADDGLATKEWAKAIKEAYNG